MLGATQEKWLESGLEASRATWNILAQQTTMAQLDQKPGPGRRAWTDGWDGYPTARKRLIDFMAERKVVNPVVIGGDVHMFFVNDLKRDFDNPASPTVATEFVGAGVTSQPSFTRDMLESFASENRHVKLADNRYRGYTRMEITPKGVSADLRAMENVALRDSPCTTLASFVVENGRPGAQKA
jgi:alkaline phosphatase D